ncbi:hypothetical protein KCP69_16505 [Salmonella enterica subsp. enterica]|nr:hypothetical protein KCP69_16505 [Salmonella enterica subsp. enterica]
MVASYLARHHCLRGYSAIKLSHLRFPVGGGRDYSLDQCHSRTAHMPDLGGYIRINGRSTQSMMTAKGRI